MVVKYWNGKFKSHSCVVLLNKITKTLLKLYYLCTCLCGCAEAVEEDLLTQAADEEAIEASKKAMVELKKKEDEEGETKRIVSKRTLELGECGSSSEEDVNGGTPTYVVDSGGAPQQESLAHIGKAVPKAAKTKVQKPAKAKEVPVEDKESKEALEKVHPVPVESKECLEKGGDPVARQIDFEKEAAALTPQGGLLGSFEDKQDTQRDDDNAKNGDTSLSGGQVPRPVATPQVAVVPATEPESQASLEDVLDVLNRANTNEGSVGQTPKEPTPVRSQPPPPLLTPPLLTPPLPALNQIPPLPPALGEAVDTSLETVPETKKAKKQRIEDEKKIHAKRMCFYRSLESTGLRFVT